MTRPTSRRKRRSESEDGSEAEDAATAVTTRSRRRRDPEPETILKGEIPTGSTLLNLALSDNPNGGFAKGRLANLIGDSSSGKTFIAFSMFAEIHRIPGFDSHDFRYDDSEHANQFDMERMFGSVSERIEPPEKDEHGDDKPSRTIEDFQSHLMKLDKNDEPFVYVEDSFDALDSEADIKKAKKSQKAREEGDEDAAGSYRLAVPRVASEMLRRTCGMLKRTDSFVLVISQTRDNIGATFGEKRTRSGGRALKFYASHEIWLAEIGKITVVRKERKRTIGINVRAKVSKNKCTGKYRTVDFPIYYDYGIDDIGSCVDWLVAEKVWKKEKGKQIIHADGLKMGYSGTRDRIIAKIESEGLENDLKTIVGKAWLAIEEDFKMDNRKRKYE